MSRQNLEHRQTVSMVALTLALLASWAGSNARAQPILPGWVANVLIEEGAVFDGATITDHRNPNVTVRCGGYLESVWQPLELTGEDEPCFARCELSGTLGDYECDAAQSSRGLCLDQSFGTHDPPHFWSSFHARPGSLCEEAGGAVAVLDSADNPGSPFVADFDEDGVVDIVVEQGDPVPEGNGATFTSVGPAATAGDYIAFGGTGPAGLSGVYVYDLTLGTSTRIVDSTMARPRAPGNYGPLTAIGLFPHGTTTTLAWGDASGVYVAGVDPPSAPTQPAAVGDLYAVGKDVHGPFNTVSFSGPDRLIFQAQSDTFQTGIYSVDLATPGTIRRHADNETTYGGGAWGFGFLQNPSAEGNNVWFEAFNGSLQYLGAFVDTDEADGEVEAFLLRNDSFDGKTVQTVVVSPESAVRGGQVVLTVHFTNNTGGVYIFTEELLIADFEEGNLDEWSGHQP